VESKRPRLVAVPGRGSEEGGVPAQADLAAATPPARRRTWLAPVLALLLALALAGAFFQSRRADGLVDRVGELERDLVQAEARLAAQQQRVREVRDAVAGVRSDLQALEALLASEAESSEQP